MMSITFLPFTVSPRDFRPLSHLGVQPALLHRRALPQGAPFSEALRPLGGPGPGPRGCREERIFLGKGRPWVSRLDGVGRLPGPQAGLSGAETSLASRGAVRGAPSVLPEALGSRLNPGAHGLLANLGSSPARDPSVSSPRSSLWF